MRNFAKFLLLAQSSSDGGKGRQEGAHNASTAVDAGYALKDVYIRQAIAEARTLDGVQVSRGDGDGMTIIYFDIRGYGQVSFHSFADFPHVPGGGVWNKKIGGSQRVCRRLNKTLGLQHY